MKLNSCLSLKSLIVFGFVIAVIPLFLAVMYAAVGMRETSTLGRTVNTHVFEQTKTIRLVLQKASDIERKAKLFVLLSDPALRQPYERQSYEAVRTSFKQALSYLLKLDVDNRTALVVNELSEKESLIYQQILGSANENNLELPIDEAFRGLRESAATLSREFENHVDHEFNELYQLSESLEDGLLLKGGVLLSISFCVMTLLLVVLSRSMRQLDLSIRRLGAGDLANPILVSGPSDLRYLGNRLEWLRTHLQELEASKHQFMQNVAREIEIPLTGLRRDAEILAAQIDYDPNSRRQATVQTLCTNIDKLNAVSTELIRYSQIDYQPAADRKESVDFKVLLESVAEVFQPTLDQKSIALRMLVRPVQIHGFPEQLSVVVEQLLTNALNNSPENSEIRIMLREACGQMEFEVEDEGLGLDDEERPHIFEPFYRVKQSLATNQYEPGLGLAIVKEYVTNHQGKVEAIDARQDQTGTRIRVQIPIKPDE